MRAVNLLPEKHRPRRATGSQQGSAYAVLGVLGVVLIALLCYVLTLNSINSKREATERAKVDAGQAEAQAKTLSAYGDFSEIKEARVESVKDLAQGRFDWERLVREVAHVLPKDVWLLSSDASTTPVTTGAAPAPATPGAAPSGPMVKLIGCARTQSQVAVTLVRMRALEGATDVKLNESKQPDLDSSTGGSASGGSSAGGSENCGATDGKPNYKFEAEISFEPNSSTAGAPGGRSAETPARLGGGS